MGIKVGKENLKVSLILIGVTAGKKQESSQ